MKRETIIDFDIKCTTMELLLNNNNYKHNRKLTNVFISKNDNATLFLDEDGNLLTLQPKKFKKGLFIKLSNSEFYRYDIDEKIIKLERFRGEEDNNFIALSKSGNIYVYGLTSWMDEYGTLGYGKYIDNISLWIKEGCPYEDIEELTCITNDIEEKFIDIQTFASGFVALSEKGEIWGTYEIGHWCFNERRNIYKNRKFRMLYNDIKDIKEIATCHIGLAFLTNSGDVYVSGIPTSGNCNDYMKRRLRKPRKLSGKWKHIYSNQSIILMNENNELYGGERGLSSLLNKSYKDDNRFFRILKSVTNIRYNNIEKVQIKNSEAINTLVKFTLKDGTEELYLMDMDDVRGIKININL